MWYLWILTKAIKMLCLFLFLSLRLYMEFIGREKARAYLQCIYCKIKQWIQRELSHTIKSRCACVWNIWWIYVVGNPNSTFLLENLSLFWNLETLAREQGLSYSSLFFRRASKYPLFYISRTLVHFFSTLFSFLSFFMNNFCIATCLFLATKLLRDSNKNFGAFIWGISYRVYFLCLLLV